MAKRLAWMAVLTGAAVVVSPAAWACSTVRFGQTAMMRDDGAPIRIVQDQNGQFVDSDYLVRLDRAQAAEAMVGAANAVIDGEVIEAAVGDKPARVRVLHIFKGDVGPVVRVGFLSNCDAYFGKAGERQRFVLYTRAADPAANPDAVYSMPYTVLGTSEYGLGNDIDRVLGSNRRRALSSYPR